MHNDRGIKEIIDQLLCLVSNCLQFLSLFLSYRTSFIDFICDMKLFRNTLIVCLPLLLFFQDQEYLLLILIYYWTLLFKGLESTLKYYLG